MEKAKSYTYTAIFSREDDGRYSVRFPQLDGCFTEGNDFDDARNQAIEAMSLHLYGMEQDGEAIPEYSPEVETQSGEIAVSITAWMTPFRDAMENRSVKKNLTIPAWLYNAAEQKHVNYSAILQSALKDYLGIYHP